MKTAKFFKDEEFKRCSPPCSIEDMQQSTLDMLDKLRELAGIPIVLNSAYRSPEHDKARGRSGTGAHTTGHAVDIRCNTGTTRYKVLRAAFAAGFKRIGVEGSFIHVDNSDNPAHVQNTTWIY